MAAINGTERYVNAVNSPGRSNFSTHIESQDSCFWCFLMLDILAEFFGEQKIFCLYMKTIVLIDLMFSTFPFVFIWRYIRGFY